MSEESENTVTKTAYNDVIEKNRWLKSYVKKMEDKIETESENHKRALAETKASESRKWLLKLRGVSMAAGISAGVAFLSADGAKANMWNWISERGSNILSLWKMLQDKITLLNLNKIVSLGLSFIAIIAILAIIIFAGYFLIKKISNIFTYERDTADYRLEASRATAIGLFWACIIGYDDLISLIPFIGDVITIWLITAVIAFIIINRKELHYFTNPI